MSKLTMRIGGALLAAAGALAMAASSQAQDEIVLGAALALTGPVASGGTLQREALILAIEDINAAGGIGGKPLRIEFEDTQFSNSVAVNAYLKLAKHLRPPFIFMNSLTSQALAIEGVVARERIPTMYAGGGIKIRERENPWMFRIRPADTVQAMGMVDAITNTFKAKKVAIIHVQDEFGTGAASIVSEELGKLGVEIVATEVHQARDNDMSAQLLNIRDSGAEVLLVLAYNRDGALIAKQRRSLGIDMPFIFNTALAMPGTLALVEPEDLEGVYAATDAVVGSRSEEAAAYAQRFEETTGVKPDSFDSSYYDGMMMVAAAIEAVGEDREAIRDYLDNIAGYDGLTRVYTTDANNDMAHTSVLVSFTPGTKDKVVVGTFELPLDE